MTMTSCFAFRKAEANGTSLKVHALVRPDPDEQMDFSTNVGNSPSPSSSLLAVALAPAIFGKGEPSPLRCFGFLTPTGDGRNQENDGFPIKNLVRTPPAS
jgi:hypothetical protein